MFIRLINREFDFRHNYINPHRSNIFNKELAVTPIILCAVVFAGFAQSGFRGGFGLFNWLTQFAAIALVVIYCASCISRDDNLRPDSVWIIPVVIGSLLFIVLNLGLLAMGVTSLNYRAELISVNRILSPLGVTIDRITFPISGGQNATGILAVLMFSIAAAAITLYQSGWRRILAVVTCALCILSVVLADAKGGYLGLLAVIAVVFLRHRPKAIISVFALAATLTILPLIAKAVVAVVPPEIIFKFFGQNLPSGFDAVAVLTTGRNFIWDVSINKLIGDPVNMLFGYGVRAHLTSGVSAEYAWLFGGNNLHTLHNWLLQIVFEYGLFGLTIFLMVYFRMARTSISCLTDSDESAEQRACALAVVLILLTFVVCGATEAVLSSSMPDQFIFFGLCLGFAQRIGKRIRTQDSKTLRRTA